MQFLLLTYFEEAEMKRASEAEFEAQVAAYRTYSKMLVEAGVFQSGNALMATERARSIRVRDGAVMATDGPFAETKEQLGGYYLIDCPTLADAERWAAQVPAAFFGTVEVRPIWDY